MGRFINFYLFDSIYYYVRNRNTLAIIRPNTYKRVHIHLYCTVGSSAGGKGGANREPCDLSAQSNPMYFI